MEPWLYLQLPIQPIFCHTARSVYFCFQPKRTHLEVCHM